MSIFSVIHLSDLHLADQKWEDSRLIVEGLIEDIKSQTTERGIAVGACIFSGDLYQAGGPSLNQSLFEEKVLEPILVAIELEKDQVFVCAGNHDIDREVVRKNGPIQSGLLTQLRSRHELNKFYDDHSQNPEPSYFARMKSFKIASSEYGKTNLIQQNEFYSTYRLLMPDGLTIGIAAFNTAWLSTGEEGDIDRGKLLLPERAIFSAVRDLKDTELRIALHHHPLDYLADFCRFDARALLYKHFNLVCSGHMHQPMPLFTTSPVGDAVASEAGALYTWREYYNGYCIISIDTLARSVTFRHRKWSDSPAYKFVSANEFDADGQTVFFWGNDAQIGLTKLAIDVNQRFAPILESMASEHMLSSHATTGAPKGFAELYVPTPVSVRRTEADEISVQSTYLTIEEIVEGTTPQIIYGNREAGKTSFGYRIASFVCTSLISPVRIPVFIDLEKVSPSTSMLKREAQKLLLASGMPSEIKRFLEAGLFVFIIDNYKPNDAKQVGVLDAFIKEFSKNKYILFADETGTPFEKKAVSQSSFSYRALSLHPLKRREVKELTRRWLEPSGLYSDAAFYAVLKKIQNSGLPTTAYVVSMIAWTLERQNLNANLNEASLLERFVEAILNKADVNEVSRATMDFTIRESFLCELSRKLRETDVYTISLVDLDALAVTFFMARGWKENAANFVRDLILTGILIEVEGTVGFRYRCLREYFLAKYIHDDDDYREFICNESNYLDYARELDILTGLRRKDSKLLNQLIDFTERRVTNGLEPVDLAQFDNTNFRFGDGTIEKRPDSLRDLGLDDDVVEDILASADASKQPTRVRGDLEEGSHPPSKERIHDLSTAYASMVLLSKVVRNSELLADNVLKERAVRSVLMHWGQFIGYLVTSFDTAVDTVRDDSDRRPIDALNDEQKQFVEHLIKIMLPLVFSASIHSSLGTEKLRFFFESIVEDKDNSPLIIRLLTCFLLIDISFIDRSDAATDMIKKVESFAKATNSRFIIELICQKLLLVYSTPNLGERNRKAIEALYSETQLRVKGIPLKSIVYGSQKSGIVQGMRKHLSKQSSVDATKIDT